MQELFYATTNPGKFAEVEAFFKQYAPGVTIYQYAEDIAEIQTNDQNLIASYKAQQAWDRLQQPVLVDDAGIYFEKYNSFPGTMSKFVYQSIGLEGLFKLVDPHDKAFFKVSLAYAYGPCNIEIFESICYGSIVYPKNVDIPATLPYLAIFAPHGEQQTLAELRLSDKMHHYNPRISSLQKFLQWQNH